MELLLLQRAGSGSGSDSDGRALPWRPAVRLMVLLLVDQKEAGPQGDKVLGSDL